jgi:hypothetical protein
MKLNHLAIAAGLAVAALSANAQTSTFVNNGGVHEAYEYASDTFQLPVASLLDKFTFSLAAESSLKASVVALGGTGITGTVSLYQDAATDTLVNSFSLGAGSWTFASLAAGDYYYTVNVSATSGGGFVLGSNLGAPITPVPEPETYALLLAGLGAIGFLVRRRAS